MKRVKVMKIDFEDAFDEDFLSEGYYYYLDWNVNNVVKKQNIITANVLGTKRYKVEIEEDSGKYIGGSCKCPYSDGVGDCKHIAALLYYLNNENNIESNLESKKEVIEDINPNIINTILNKIDKDELIDFIKNALTDDNDLCEKFRVRFMNYLPKLSKSDYKEKIRYAIKKC